MPILAPDGRLPPLKALLRAAVLGRLDMPEITLEIQRQIDAFTRHFRQPPAYLDGHQHVHLLPVIRQAVMLALGRLPAGTWLRDCREPAAAILQEILNEEKAANEALIELAYASSNEEAVGQCSAMDSCSDTKTVKLPKSRGGMRPMNFAKARPVLL